MSNNEGAGVIPIANHRDDLASLLELADVVRLVGREHVRDHLCDSCGGKREVEE